MNSLSRNTLSSILLARINAHKTENMASWFLESLSKAQISELNEIAIPINTKKAMGVFQGELLFLNIVRYMSISQEKQKF